MPGLMTAMGRKRSLDRALTQNSFLHPLFCGLHSRMTPHPLRIRFTPVELKARHDGWTEARQRRFIDVLAVTKSLTLACQAVGMSRTSAYKLRDRPEARQFRLAWDAALRPDFDRPIRRMAPKLMNHGQPTLPASEPLQTYPARLREQEQRLGSRRGS